MRKKRILVVDDSCLYQQLLSNVIDSSDSLEVVGVAANGKIALDMISEVKPDLVTLDILMPEMDGIQTLIEIRKRWPSISTVMVSSLTSEGSDAALDALALGACEYAIKPASAGGVEKVRAELKQDLLPKIQALCGVDDSECKKTSMSVSANRVPGEVARTQVQSQLAKQDSMEIVAIGVSTGGPDALTKMLADIPGNIGVPIVIVQHMPAQFTGKLAKRLNSVSALKVVEAQVGDKLKAGFVYIAPGDFHMVLHKIGGEVVISLNKDEPENSCRPSVDPLFRSIPEIYGNKCLGVIMTGMGSDGLAGSEVLSKAGCPIIVQDKPTSIVWGMPKLVVAAGLAQQEVPIDQMAATIKRLVGPRQWVADKKAANSDVYQNTRTSGGLS